MMISRSRFPIFEPKRLELNKLPMWTNIQPFFEMRD